MKPLWRLRSFAILGLLFESYAFCLAPPPINFEREVVNVNGEEFIVTFTNGSLDIKKKGEGEPVPATPKPPSTTPSPTHGDFFVKAVFDFWFDPIPEINDPGEPSYRVLESNHPMFPVGANVETQRFIDYGFPIPKTPTREEWIRDGKKYYGRD